MLSGGVMASDTELAEDDGVWSVVGGPTEGSFLVAELKLGTQGSREGRFTRVGMVPFTSERKLMSVLYTDAKHGTTILLSKGAPDVLMERCARVRVGEGDRPLDAAVRAEFGAHIADMSGRALRTLGVAYRTLDADEAAAVAKAHRAGVRVLMITGDHPATAGRIAADLGIAAPGARVLTGRELSGMDDAALARAVQEVSVYARVAPEHKLRIVGALKAQGHTVAMTGERRVAPASD